MDINKDTFNRIGVLNRREIEARILAPFVDALAETMPREQVIKILRETIIRIARLQGAALAESLEENGLRAFASTLEAWTRDQALELEVLAESEAQLAFNVRRCRYAEMYRALGIPELGAVLSCNRDFSLIEGFNPDVRLERTQTIMEGADFCDFRYSR